MLEQGYDLRTTEIILERRNSFSTIENQYINEFTQCSNNFKCISFVAVLYNSPKWCETEQTILSGYNYFTPNHFFIYQYKEDIYPYHALRRCENTLANINAIALNINYRKNEQLSRLKPMDVYTELLEPLCGSLIPPPSYIEHSNQLRLIYVLAEPVRLYKGRGKRAKWLKIIKRILAVWSALLNDELDIHCEPQKLASYFRVPGSKNEKTGDVVRIEPYSDERYTVQELLDGYMPDYKPPDTTKSKHSTPAEGNTAEGNTVEGNIKCLHNQYTLWLARLETFKEIQKCPDVNRENLCWLYCNALICLGEEKPLEKTLEYNDGLCEPLKPKELKSKLGAQIKSGKKYKVSNAKLNELVGKDVTDMTKRQKDKLAKIEAGTTRKQIADKNYAKVCELYDAGYKRAQIIQLTGLSKYYVGELITRHRKERNNFPLLFL